MSSFISSSGLTYLWSKIKATFSTIANTVTSLGTSGNYLTWTKNGTTNNITVPYATSAESATKVGSSTVGSSIMPIYLNSGTPTQVTSLDGALVGGYIGYSIGGFLVTHPEVGYGIIVPYVYNDLAFLTSQGGSCTIYSTTETDLTKETLAVKTDWSSTSTVGNLFDGSPSYWSGGNNNATAMNADGLIIDITLPNLKTHANKFYIDFGNSNWGFGNIDILLKNSANETNYVSKVSGGVVNDKAQYYDNISHSSTPQGGGSSVSGFDRMRIHLYGRTRTSGVRIAQIGLIQYNSLGQRYTSMSRGYDDYVYRSITPNTTSTYSLGTSARRWNNIYGTTLNATTGSFTSYVSVGGNIAVTGTSSLRNAIYIDNGKIVYWKDNGGVLRRALDLDSSNNLGLGYGIASAGYDTYIDGNNVYLRYGTSHTKGLSLFAGGNVSVANSLAVGSGLTVAGTTTLTGLLTANGGIVVPSGQDITVGGKNVLTEHQDISGLVPDTRTVNGKALSSNITLTAADVSALPSTTVIPTKTSDLTNDSDFITSADIPEGAAASSTTPLMDGTAAVGTETRFARGDHRHPTDTSRQAAITSSSKLSADLIEDGTTNKTVTSTEKSTWNSKGTYSKPSGGIPKTDLASAVQTSLGLADTALQSYTETDPVFAASVAADITSSDITNWNSKTSNIGTITGITMNGASKGTSGVVDLGTVITAHQDISGKADKATTLAGYGITDAKIASGVITLGSNTITPLTSSSSLAWSKITGTPTTLSGYGITDAASSSALSGYLPLSGGTMTGNITAYNILLPNQKAIQVADSNGEYGSALSMTSNDNLMLGRSTVGGTVVVGNSAVILRIGGTSSDYDALTIYSNKNTNLKANLSLPNNYSVLINDTQGTGQNAIKLNSSNHIVIGYGNAVDISGNTSITGTASVSSNLSVSGTTTLGGYVYMPNQNRIYFKNSAGTSDMIAMYQTAANHLYIGYGFAENGYSTYIAGNTVELRYGTSRSTGLTLGSDGNVTATGSVTASSFVGDLTGNANTATTLKTARQIWGQSFDGSSVVRGTLSMFPDTQGMNNDTAKLWFRSNTSSSGDGYSPYIQGIYHATTGRKRLSVFQINNANYTGTHNEVFTILPDGKVGVGTISPSTLLHVNGVVTCTSVTQTSDESKKEKIDDININVEKIAQAPNITFKWKEGEDEELHGGTIAQYWEDIVPYYVHGDECKTLEYNNLAMSCSIEVAKEVVKLKEENAMLKKELAEIKEMLNKLIK